jgi:hypothetical protein
VKISFHGGKCCGIKHIHELGANPKAMMGTLYSRELKGPDWTHDKQLNPDTWGLDVNSEVNAYPHEAPKETALERLDRYLKFLEDWRPGGITEIVLCDYLSSGGSSPDDQTTHWEPLLLERGFVLMTPGGVLNSNSENRIYVYYKITEEEDD